MREVWLALGLLLALGEATAQVKILAGDAPDIEVGEIVPMEQIFTIPEQRRIRFIEQPGGQVCTRRGPYTGSLTCPSPLDSLRVLKRRGGWVKAKSGTHLWTLDVQRGGHFCFVASWPITLWRGVANQPEVLFITALGGDTVIKVDWPRHKHDVFWPRARLPIRDGEEYELSLGAKKALVTMHEIPKHYVKAARKSSWMLEQGCDTQVELLFADDKAKTFLY